MNAEQYELARERAKARLEEAENAPLSLAFPRPMGWDRLTIELWETLMTFQTMGEDDTKDAFATALNLVRQEVEYQDIIGDQK